MAFKGIIKFITEDSNRAIVEEFQSSTAYAANSAEGHKVLGSDFSAKAKNDVIDYTYNSPSDFNDGRDITII